MYVRLDAAVRALGRLRAVEAVPALARLIREERTDQTRASGPRSGGIVGKRFRPERTVEGALTWLDRSEN